MAYLPMGSPPPFIYLCTTDDPQDGLELLSYRGTLLSLLSASELDCTEPMKIRSYSLPSDVMQSQSPAPPCPPPQSFQPMKQLPAPPSPFQFMPMKQSPAPPSPFQFMPMNQSPAPLSPFQFMSMKQSHEPFQSINQSSAPQSPFQFKSTPIMKRQETKEFHALHLTATNRRIKCYDGKECNLRQRNQNRPIQFRRRLDLHRSGIH